MVNQGDLDLTTCLTKIGCEHHLSVFLDNEIDFDCFKSLTEDDLARLFPGKIGPQKKLLKEIERLNFFDDGRADCPNKPTPLNKTRPSPTKTKVNSVETSAGDLTKNTAIVSAKTEIQPQMKTKVATVNEKAVSNPQISNTARPIVLNQKPPPSVEKGFLQRHGVNLPTPAGFAATIGIGLVTRKVTDTIFRGSSENTKITGAGSTVAAGGTNPADVFAKNAGSNNGDSNGSAVGATPSDISAGSQLLEGVTPDVGKSLITDRVDDGAHFPEDLEDLELDGIVLDDIDYYNGPNNINEISDVAISDGYPENGIREDEWEFRNEDTGFHEEFEGNTAKNDFIGEEIITNDNAEIDDGTSETIGTLVNAFTSLF